MTQTGARTTSMAASATKSTCRTGPRNLAFTCPVALERRKWMVRCILAVAEAPRSGEARALVEVRLYAAHISPSLYRLLSGRCVPSSCTSTFKCGPNSKIKPSEMDNCLTKSSQCVCDDKYEMTDGVCVSNPCGPGKKLIDGTWRAVTLADEALLPSNKGRDEWSESTNAALFARFYHQVDACQPTAHRLTVVPKTPRFSQARRTLVSTGRRTVNATTDMK